jgi:hypothetical protein
VFFSRNWLQKYADVVHADLVDEEIRFLEDPPHLARIREVFALARVDYGRIDYAVTEHGVVTWEINTNPMLAAPIAKTAPLRLASQRAQSERLARALRALDDGLPAAAPEGAFTRRWLDLIASVRKKAGGFPGMRRLRRP